MGLSFLPEYIVRPALAAGRLARLNVPDCTVEMHRQLFYHRDKWLTPQMKAFIELVRQPRPALPANEKSTGPLKRKAEHTNETAEGKPSAVFFMIGGSK